MQEIQALHIKKLTLNLVMLVALISGGQRGQNIHDIRVCDTKILDSKVLILIISLIKTKPVEHGTPVFSDIKQKRVKSLCCESRNWVFKDNKRL